MRGAIKKVPGVFRLRANGTLLDALLASLIVYEYSCCIRKFSMTFVCFDTEFFFF